MVVPTSYSELLHTLNTSDREDVYTTLLNKEQKTLDVVNKVVNHEAGKEMFYRAFFNMPLSVIFSDFAQSLSKLVNDLSIAKTNDDIASIFKQNKLVFYVGVVVIVLATLIMLVEST